MITAKVWGVVILFEHGLAKEDEGPWDGQAVRRLPFFLDSVKGFPSQLSRRTIHEAVLGGFWEAEIAAFASGLDSHRLEPGAHWQAPIEGQPDERSNFVQAGVMPHSRNDLGYGWIAQVEVLNEGQDVGNVVCSPGVLVPSFGWVAKEGGIRHGGRFLLVPVARVLGEVSDKASFKNPVEGGGLTRGQEIFG